MQSIWRHQLLLATLSAALFLPRLGATRLWDIDEAIFSQAAQEMIARHDYVVPYFNDEVFPDKPPLMYWTMIALCKVFGSSEFSLRLGSALFGLAGVVVTYHLGRLLFSASVGLWGGIILATSLHFTLIARAATPDAYLVFFSALSILILARGAWRRDAAGGGSSRAAEEGPRFTSVSLSPRRYAAAYAAMGLGVLTKGPIGVLLPTMVWGLFLLLRQDSPTDSPNLSTTAEEARWRSWLTWIGRTFAPRRVASTIWSMRPFTAIGVVLLIAGPWYAAVGARTGGDWLVGFFGVHNIGRFLRPMEHHSGPFFYYLVAVAIGLFPWSIFLAPAVGSWRRTVQGDHPWHNGCRLMTAWLVVWIGFFSLASTKLPSYVLPAYPALATLSAAWVDRWLRGEAPLSRRRQQAAWGTLVLVGVGLVIVMPFVARYYLGENLLLGTVGLVLVAGGFVWWKFAQEEKNLRAATSLVVTAVLFLAGLFDVAALSVDRHQNSQLLAERARFAAGADPAIASYNYFKPSLVFYARRPIEKLASPEEVNAFFDEHRRDAFLFTTDLHFEQIAARLPADVAVMAKSPRFLRPGNVLLLGRSRSRAEGGEATATIPPVSSARRGIDRR